MKGPRLLLSRVLHCHFMSWCGSPHYPDLGDGCISRTTSEIRTKPGPSHTTGTMMVPAHPPHTAHVMHRSRHHRLFPPVVVSDRARSSRAFDTYLDGEVGEQGRVVDGADRGGHQDARQHPCDVLVQHLPPQRDREELHMRSMLSHDIVLISLTRSDSKQRLIIIITRRTDSACQQRRT